MKEPVPVSAYRITDHARQEMTRRQISEAEVALVLAAPDQVEEVRAGRLVFQARLTTGEAQTAYLLRVFVDVDRSPAEVVTAYRTSKIAKYWSSKQ